MAEAVLLIGLQGAGKSTFCRERLFETHIRINLDMLKTRHREQSLFKACLAAQQSLVVDNTNASRDERASFLVPARDAGFRTIGYYFQSRVEDCVRRNDQRALPQRVPLRGILGTSARLARPVLEEGFEQLFYVWIDDGGRFVVEDWIDEV